MLPSGQRLPGRTVPDKLSDSYRKSKIEITDSARKHSVEDEQIRFVIEHCGLVFDQPAPDGNVDEGRLVYLGDDAHGVPFEVMAVTNEAGDLRVIHAMKLRPGYQREYEEALPWRKLSSS